MDTFQQNTLFVKKTYTFKPDGLDYYSKDFDGKFTRFIHFDDIKARTECRLYTENQPKVLTTGMIISGIALVRAMVTSGDNLQTSLISGAVILFFGLLTILAYFIVRVHYFLIELENNTQLFIILNKPNKAAMESLIDEIYERRKHYYRNKYFFIDYENERTKELQKMNWLMSESIISENEFNVVVDEINDNLH